MGKVDRKVKLDIISLYKKGTPRIRIKNTLNERGHSITRDAVNYWIKAYQNGTFNDCLEEKVYTSRVVSDRDVKLIKETIEHDNCVSSTDIHRRLIDDGATFSQRTTQRTIDRIGYTNSKPRYAQMVRDANKVKRTDFCRTLIDTNDDFNDVIFSDETTVQLHNNKTVIYREKGKLSKCLPKPKHPLKLHVWGAISRKGASIVGIFQDIMDSVFYTNNVLKELLLPFVRRKFPHGHRFQQDNDPKHTSRMAKTFMLENGINWIPWPAESPDLNPIEMVWNELKRDIAKKEPRTKDALSDCIEDFWCTHMTKERCNTYIDHMYKAVPVCALLNGVATGDCPNRIFGAERSRGKSVAYFEEKLKSDPIVMDRVNNLV